MPSEVRVEPSSGPMVASGGAAVLDAPASLIDSVESAPTSGWRGSSLAGVLVLLLVVGALVTYKASASLGAIAKARALGTMAPKVAWIAGAGLPDWLRPFAGTASYFAWVGIALTFGLVLGALVRAVVPERLLRSLAAGGPAGHLLAGIAGAPLMLCSCCVAPLFDGVYERTRRVGPALALMFAAPGLNPAALALTFILFPLHLALGRLGLALLIVFGVSAALGKLPGSRESVVCSREPASDVGFFRAFAAALRDAVRRTLPGIVVGVLASAVLLQLAPIQSLAGGSHGLAFFVVVLLAALVALPTFGEIPVALAALAAGAPESFALGILVAGPIINLPSLMTLRKTVSTRIAFAAGLGVYLVTAAGSLLLA